LETQLPLKRKLELQERQKVELAHV
jgi:hypothetical protein